MDHEIERKAIHMLSALFVFPLLYSRDLFELLVLSSLIAALRLEFTRFHIGRLILFDELLRENERERAAGYFYLLLGLSLLISITHNTSIVVAGILIAAIADGLSAIVGIRFGRVKRVILGKTRSLEGTLTGFLATFLVAFPLLGLKLSLVSSVLYVLNDLFWPGDDNVTNPLIPLVAWRLLLLARSLRRRSLRNTGKRLGARL